MFKKVSMILMVAMMVITLAGFAQAARIPGPQDQFVLKAGTEFLAVVAFGPGQYGKGIAKAFEDVTITVTELKDGYVFFEYKDFPHDCPHHGREIINIAKGAVPFDYFETNPDAFSPKE